MTTIERLKIEHLTREHEKATRAYLGNIGDKNLWHEMVESEKRLNVALGNLPHVNYGIYR